MEVSVARSLHNCRGVKNPVLPHGASSKEKAILAIHPRSSGRGILAFSRKGAEQALERGILAFSRDKF
jgi:hypothetical protein